MPIIQIHTHIQAPIEIVFDLARSIDLHKISTEQTLEEAIAGKTSGLIGLGEWVTWRARHLGLKQTLTSKITEFDSPRMFVDEMVQGAFKRFRHEHLFESDENGHTLMQDIFDYTSPCGLLGEMVDALFLEGYMKRLLVKRNLVVKDFAESGQGKEIVGL